MVKRSPADALQLLLIIDYKEKGRQKMLLPLSPVTAISEYIQRYTQNAIVHQVQAENFCVHCRKTRSYSVSICSQQ